MHIHSCDGAALAAGSEGVNAPSPAGWTVGSPGDRVRVSQLSQVHIGRRRFNSDHGRQIISAKRGFHSERDVDDPDGPGSSLLGPSMNASRMESAESGGYSREQLLLEVIVVLMCVIAVTGTNQSYFFNWTATERFPG